MYDKLREWINRVSSKFINYTLRLRSVKAKQNLWGFLFLVPSLVFLFVFKLIPMFWAGRISLYNYDIVSKQEFIGFKNYIDLMQDKDFLTALSNSAYYVIGSVTIIVILSLILA
jgi:ABC-type sugar transport system permease subunit